MIDEIKFQLKAVHDSDVRHDMTAMFEHFCKVHDGEMWTDYLLDLLYNQMEIVAFRYGYKFVSTVKDNIKYVKVVKNGAL